MIRVSVSYPATEGARFDMDYYLDKHIPLTSERYGDALLGVEVYQDIALEEALVALLPQPVTQTLDVADGDGTVHLRSRRMWQRNVQMGWDHPGSAKSAPAASDGGNWA